MKKITRLRLCDWSLLLLTVVMLASGLQLEINPTGPIRWVWIHIALGVIFAGMILWHVGLHHVPGDKKVRPKSRRHKAGRWLGMFFLLMLLSGIIASCGWIGTYVHSTTGGVHGKIGFVFIVLVIMHVRKHSGFYYKRVGRAVYGKG